MSKKQTLSLLFMMNKELEKIAIDRLKAFEPKEEPYYLCYSGGKDSDCIKILAELAGVKYEAVHNLTTVDAPETVRYIKSQSDIKIEYPEISMWRLIENKGMPPTRLIRYCCEELKERGGKGRVKVTGVRWYESENRKKNSGLIKILGKPKTTQKYAKQIGADFEVSPKGGLIMNTDNDKSRRMVEHCYRTTSTMVNPIVEWTDSDVWQFLRYYGCESNPLYCEGYKRIGCIGCPLSTQQQQQEFERYPIYKENYIKAFDRMLQKLRLKPNFNGDWKNGEDVFNWWVGINPNQITLFDLMENEYE